jgi:hypothetical protein
MDWVGATSVPAIGAAGIELTWQNVEMVTVHSISMDVEPLFTRSPFASQAGSTPPPGAPARRR